MNQLLKTNSERRTAIYRVPVDVVLSLRHRLLRAGLPPESAQFEGDDDLSTWHIALFHPTPLEDNTPPVCCASFIFNSYKSEPAWQLRGMCTEPLHQGCGFGVLLLTTAEEALIADSAIRLFWCNARMPAVPFYGKQGWNIDSEVFDIPTAGPHCRMYKRIL